jgi:hypothetical protein
LLPPVIALLMEAAGTSETSINFYQTTRRNNLEDSHLHTRRHENLKSHQEIKFKKRKATQSSVRNETQRDRQRKVKKV